MEVDWGRALGAFFGFLLSIPAVFISLTIRWVNWVNWVKGVVIINLSNRFIVLGCGIFRVKRRSFPPKCLVSKERRNYCSKFLSFHLYTIFHFLRWILTLVCITM